MDFNSLMAKMRELDQPAVSTQEIPATEACGDAPMPMSMPPSMSDQQPPPAHPSMSVNLNAQGMDNIESLLKLMTKVNPDMINQPAGMAPPMPSMTAMPSLTPPGPSISSIGDLGNLDAGPLKMLPDLDKGPESDHSEPDADNMGGPSDMDADNMPPMISIGGDDEGPGDSKEPKGPEGEEPEDDKGEEPEDKEKKTDEWANEPDPELKSINNLKWLMYPLLN